MKRTLSTSLFLMVTAVPLGLVISSTATAEIFKCTHKSGKVYYNDKPCPTNQKEKKFKATKDPVNGYVPKFQPVQPLTEDGIEAAKKVEKDDFGTPQYKGKETKQQHDARVKYEENMEKRAEVEKQARTEIEKQIETFKESGETEKVELLTRVLEESR